MAPGHHGEPRTGGQSLISGLKGQPCYRPCSSAGPTGHAMIRMFSLSTPWTSSLCGHGHARAGVKVLFAAPNRPDDPRELVRDRNRGFVVPAPCRDGDSPVLKPRALARGTKRPLSREQDGASSVRQQTPKVDIAALADATEMAAEPARAFAGRQAEPARKMPGAAKRVDVCDGAEERRRGDDADARNREEAHGIGRGDSRQLAIDVLDAAFKGTYLIVDERQRLAQLRGQSNTTSRRFPANLVGSQQSRAVFWTWV